MPSSVLKLPTSEDVAAARGNIRGFALRTPARQIDLPATVVVPEGSAMTKAKALTGLGAKVIRLPFDEWWTVLTTRRLAGEEGVFIHPVAESAVLAGNATLGAEIIEDQPDCDAVIVPFGGGGRRRIRRRRHGRTSRQGQYCLYSLGRQHRRAEAGRHTQRPEPFLT